MGPGKMRKPRNHARTQEAEGTRLTEVLGRATLAGVGWTNNADMWGAERMAAQTWEAHIQTKEFILIYSLGGCGLAGLLTGVGWAK